MTLKISISGVRGYVPESLTPEICLDLAKAFGTYLRGGKVVIGTDPRASSEFIKGIVFSGLLATGCAVVDIGICPTPTVGVMVRKLGAAGGIVITASHNPLPWNGLKFMREDGIFLNEEQARRFLKFYEKKYFKLRPAAKGVSANTTAIATHLALVLKTIKPSAIKKRKFKVAVDACNGAGSVAMIKLLEKLGCKVFPINVNLKLPFPHNPEPIAENLSELRELVKTKKADIGFAMDSDADRLAVVAENGEPLGEEATLALAVRYVLERRSATGGQKKIVTVNLSTSRMIEDLCRENGALVIRTKVGEVHVAEELKRVNGLIGGEGNGGVIFPPVGFNRDSLAGAALLLSYLADSGQPLTKLAAALPHYEMVKSKVECRNLDEVNDLVEKAKEVFQGEDLILTEGVKVVFPDAWVHVRASNTEPIIRIMAEARTRAKAEELIKRIAA